MITINRIFNIHIFINKSLRYIASVYPYSCYDYITCFWVISKLTLPFGQGVQKRLFLILISCISTFLKKHRIKLHSKKVTGLACNFFCKNT